MSVQNVDAETRLILSCINGGKRLSDLDYAKINWKRILERASANKVLYIFSKRLLASLPSNELTLSSNLKEIVAEGDRWLDKLSRTLNFLNLTLGKSAIPFLVVKTYRILPFVTRDVDVFVERTRLNRTIRVMQHLGTCLRSPSLKDQYDVLVPGLLRIDLHTDFVWRGSKYIDLSSVEEGVKEESIQGVRCTVPRNDVEVLLSVAHMIYELMHIPLIEFLFIKSRAKKTDWNFLMEQAKKYNWYGSLLTFLSFLNAISEALYFLEGELVEYSEIPNLRIKRLSMPYLLPTAYALRTILEKPRSADMVMFDATYYAFTKLRYYASRCSRVPMYDHWFRFNSLR